MKFLENGTRPQPPTSLQRYVYCEFPVNKNPIKRDKTQNLFLQFCVFYSGQNIRVKSFELLSCELLMLAKPINLQVFFSKTTSNLWKVCMQKIYTYMDIHKNHTYVHKKYT